MDITVMNKSQIPYILHFITKIKLLPNPFLNPVLSLNWFCIEILAEFRCPVEKIGLFMY